MREDDRRELNARRNLARFIKDQPPTALQYGISSSRSALLEVLKSIPLHLENSTFTFVIWSLEQPDNG